MKKIWVAAAIFLLASCNENDVMAEIERAEKADAQAAADAEAASSRFLEEAAAKPGAQRTESGLVVEFVRRGRNQSLPHPAANSAVLVHYEGRLADGTTFDSSIERGQPAQFSLAEVVPGFTESIMMMRPGDEVIAYFPPELGYGSRGSPPDIPPNAALQFRIQLLAFQDANGNIIRAPQ